MATLVRALLIALVAAFAVGTVAHSASVTVMDVEMALSSADMGMSDCQGCPDADGQALSCDSICVTPVMAVLPSIRTSLPPATSCTACFEVRSVAGRTGPPDPYPPRSIILS